MKTRKPSVDQNGNTALQASANDIAWILQNLKELQESVQERGERLEIDGANWADAGELQHLKKLVREANDWFNQ